MQADRPKRARPLTYVLAGIAALLAVLHLLVWWDSRDDGARRWPIKRSIETCLPEDKTCRA